MSLLRPTTGKHNSISPARNDWTNLTFYSLDLPKQEGSTSRMMVLGMKSGLMPCKDLMAIVSTSSISTPIGACCHRGESNFVLSPEVTLLMRRRYRGQSRARGLFFRAGG